jgi:hypothetical protein
MASPEVVTLPVFGLTSPEFAALGRRVAIPQTEDPGEMVFSPAFGRLEIGGSILDLSHLIIRASPDPLGEVRHRPVVERHVHREAVWLITRGAVVVGLGESVDGPDTVPSVHELRLFLAQAGDMFILPAGRWHGGIWGVLPGVSTEFLMFVNGHRPGPDGRPVDHEMTTYPEDVAIVPDRTSPGLRRLRPSATTREHESMN